MKTQEEIQRLSYDYSDKVNMSNDMTSCSIADAVTYGYTQCQQDMFDSLLANALRRLYDDKKYTEKDIIDAVLFGMQKGLNVGKVEETDNDWVNNYIKSIK